MSPIDLEFGVDPYDIVRGPDGAMWFTEHNGNRIGRLTVDGELSEFFLRDLSTPTGITVGPDGALWFAQRGVSAIGRITVDGEFTEWRTITPRAAPLSITTGADGALWFTLTAANALGRITVDGTMTEYPLPGRTRARRSGSRPARTARSGSPLGHPTRSSAGRWVAASRRTRSPRRQPA